jgi:hypothetical protein
MKALDAKVGQLIKTNYGMATVMNFLAPKSIACVLVTYLPELKAPRRGCKIGEWIYIRGFDFDEAIIVADTLEVTSE